MNNSIDRKTFEAVLTYYGANYQGGRVNSDVVDEMLNSHIENKKHIFKLFGNKLKVEKEIETVVDRETASSYISELLRDLGKDNKLIFVRNFLFSLSTEEFASNTLARDFKIFDVVIPKGMKVSKAIAKLCREEDVHEIITKHSMTIQKMKTKGKVVLSIDPIDYLTMSSNSSGWRSCHRLNGGEYRTGPIAYLRDSSSVICYIESSKPCEFSLRGEDYTHSNKTWRQIALVSPNLEFSMQERQYPNYSRINENEVSNLFKELFEKYNNTTYKVENIDTSDLNDLHIDFASENGTYRYYYNDIDNEMFSSANVVFNSKQSLCDIKGLDLPVKGEVAFCLECGDQIYDSDSLYCDSCGYGDDECDEEEEW